MVLQGGPADAEARSGARNHQIGELVANRKNQDDEEGPEGQETRQGRGLERAKKLHTTEYCMGTRAAASSRKPFPVGWLVIVAQFRA